MKNTILIFAAVAIFLGGCSSSSTVSPQQDSPKVGSALACPQCKSVLVESDPFDELEYGNAEASYYKHQCPGCQGELATLITDGEFRHKCSVCETQPYSCSPQRMKAMNKDS